MIVYFDTSDLVKLYVDEVGSERVKDIIHNATVISTSKIAYAGSKVSICKETKRRWFF